MVNRNNEMNGKHKTWCLAGIGCLIVLWAVGTWALWSEVSFEPSGLSIPIGTLSWPAHQVCLAASGQGMGANAKCPAAIWSFTVFLVQAVLMWAILLICVVIPRKKWLWLVLQAAILVLLFTGFWYWGNG